MPILYRLYLKDNITLGEGRGNTFIMLLKERRKGDCGNAINSRCSWISGGSYTGRPSESESLWKKMIGEPYSGKPNVRFDEGELEIEPSRSLRQLSTLLSTSKIPRQKCSSIFRGLADKCFDWKFTRTKFEIRHLHSLRLRRRRSWIEHATGHTKQV